ncbi:hypothetical protein NDU88_006928 [Pleurodeles waltl]|uniref:Uncharacterized protein n=1 Tax=Pleurodeles waltl TaxID=8319 RepID=A0AAV7SQZ2_PLEWA|nr:hypothetical protein NDU88_006928 [Pleurodeles waltl]
MVKGLLGARRRREGTPRGTVGETERRAAMSWGRSKTGDLLIFKNENKSILNLPRSSPTSLWRRGGPVFEYCGPTH